MFGFGFSIKIRLRINFKLINENAKKVKVHPVALGTTFSGMLRCTDVSVPSYRLLNLEDSLEKNEVLAAELRADVSWY